MDRVAATRRAQAERVARDAGLPKEVQDFLGRAAAGVAGEFTVAYKASDDSTTTLAQRPPDRRVDVAADGSVESVLRLGTGTFACRRETADGPWTCRKTAATEAGPDPDIGVFTSARIADTVQLLAGYKADYRFRVVDRRVAGARAQCLLTEPKKGGRADELCISSEGAILRVRTEQRTLEASRYRDGADASAFTLPAKPS